MKNFNKKTILKENNIKRNQTHEDDDYDYDDRWDEVYDRLFDQKQAEKARKAERREARPYSKKGLKSE
jgi:hypothetical protein